MKNKYLIISLITIGLIIIITILVVVLLKTRKLKLKDYTNLQVLEKAYNQNKIKAEKLLLYDEKTLTGVRKNASLPEVLVIPEKVENISFGAFLDEKNVRAIYFPSSVKKISSLSFRYLKNLEVIMIKGSPEIEIGAFSFCQNLKKVFIHDGTPIIKQNPFLYSPLLEKIDLKNTSNLIFKEDTFILKEDINYKAILFTANFRGKIPEEVTVIESFATGFNPFLKVKTLEFNKNLKMVKPFSFILNSVNTIKVNSSLDHFLPFAVSFSPIETILMEGEGKYKVLENTLFENEKVVLLSKNSKINSQSSILTGAAPMNKSLSMLKDVLNKHIEKLGDLAFLGCENLEETCDLNTHQFTYLGERIFFGISKEKFKMINFSTKDKNEAFNERNVASLKYQKEILTYLLKRALDNCDLYANIKLINLALASIFVPLVDRDAFLLLTSELKNLGDDEIKISEKHAELRKIKNPDKESMASKFLKDRKVKLKINKTKNIVTYMLVFSPFDKETPSIIKLWYEIDKTLVISDAFIDSDKFVTVTFTLKGEIKERINLKIKIAAMNGLETEVMLLIKK